LDAPARLDEAGDHAVDAGREAAAAAEQDLLAALDRDDDRRREPWEVHEPAARADERALARDRLRRRRAGAAEAVRAVPLDDLHRAARDAVERSRQAREERAQVEERERRRRVGLRGELGAVAGERVECAEVVDAPRREPELRGPPRRQGGPALGDEELAAAEREPERTLGRRIGRRDARLEARLLLGFERVPLAHARASILGRRRGAAPPTALLFAASPAGAL